MPFQRFNLILGCLVAVLLVPAVAPAKPVTLAETPAAVQTTIHSQMGDSKLEGIDQTNEDGEVTFDVSCTTKSDDEKGFTVAEDGTLLSLEVDLSSTPAPVQKAIHGHATGWKLEDISKNVADTDVTYEVEVSKDGQSKSFTVDEDGTVESAGVTLTETPAAVQTAINSRLAGGTLKSISENFDPDGNSFDIDATTGAGDVNSFSVGMDGTLLSVEVSLDKIPPAARKTIEAKIGEGKVLRIDKSLVEKKDKVLPYEVEGRKDGKPFDFSVGPHGRFLGMDD